MRSQTHRGRHVRLTWMMPPLRRSVLPGTDSGWACSPGESGHGVTGYARRDHVGDDPHQHHRSPQAAPRPLSFIWRIRNVS